MVTTVTKLKNDHVERLISSFANCAGRGGRESLSNKKTEATHPAHLRGIIGVRTRSNCIELVHGKKTTKTLRIMGIVEVARTLANFDTQFPGTVKSAEHERRLLNRTGEVDQVDQVRTGKNACEIRKLVNLANFFSMLFVSLEGNLLDFCLDGVCERNGSANNKADVSDSSGFTVFCHERASVSTP